MQTKDQIIADIDSYMRQFSWSKNPNWYVGIACDVEQRLFGDHRVDKQKDAWIYRKASDHNVARDAERAYHAVGCAGGPGGGDHTTIYVYAYIMAAHTDP